MRKKYTLCILLLLMFIATACDNTFEADESSERSGDSEEVSLNLNSEADYLDLVEDFEEVNIENTTKKIEDNESFYLYVGRATCPYCRIFVPKLHSAAENNLSVINYLDVENTAQDAELESFLSTINLQYVPSLISFDEEGNFDKLDIDSHNITIQEIENFIN